MIDFMISHINNIIVIQDGQELNVDRLWWSILFAVPCSWVNLHHHDHGLHDFYFLPAGTPPLNKVNASFPTLTASMKESCFW